MIDPESRSRLPRVRREDMDEEGQRLYDAVTGPESRTLVGLQGPSGIWLHSPRLGAHMRAANQYLRFHTGLARRLTELAILVTARELDNQFEWAAHEPEALREGLDSAIIDVVRHRRPVSGLGEPEAVIIAFGRELFQARKLSAETFRRAVQLFGNRGVVDLAALMGNYAMTALLLTAVDQQLRPDQPPMLPIP